MNLFNKIFGSKHVPITSNSEFWTWFQQNERTFFNVLNNKNANVEVDLFDRISPKLNELKDGYYLLAGMFDKKTAELIITDEGDARNIVFVEELIADAPKIDGWKFTALKQPDTDEKFVITMNKCEFNHQNIHFCVNQLEDYPDEIDISIIYDGLTDLNVDTVRNGVYIFLDNYLGELDSLMNIDNLSIIGRKEAGEEIIPITKLKSYLIWRQKEFIEKYEGFRHDTEEDLYSTFEATLENGNTLIAIMNTTLLDWDAKASHPWLVIFRIKYEGTKDSGLPNNEDYELMNQIEDEIMSQLKDHDGYLNLGRQTADGEREIFFACREFRLPSKVLYSIQQKYSEHFKTSYEIYKDKYWKWFDRFNQG
ncbi:DUF695 domain-containing protein [Fluviicola sp.]|uniref:DUF695 domain-containing protein n=1 Tax=Fluviicola sp. TaxID=1917219 RepID=UPI003D28D310